MKLRRRGLIFAAIVLAAVALLLLHNHLLESGGRAFKSGDYSEALGRLRPLACLGNTAAQYMLGEMYAFGWGVGKDDDVAIYWFRRSGLRAEEGRDPAAPAELAVSDRYAKGLGVKRNVEESLKWLRRAAEGGNKEAMAKLGQASQTPGSE